MWNSGYCSLSDHRPPPHDDYNHIIICIEYWLGVVSYFAFSAIGVAGNLVSILVFSERSMANTYNTYLKLLAYSDWLFVFNCFTESLIDISRGPLY